MTLKTETTDQCLRHRTTNEYIILKSIELKSQHKKKHNIKKKKKINNLNCVKSQAEEVGLKRPFCVYV